MDGSTHICKFLWIIWKSQRKLQRMLSCHQTVNMVFVTLTGKKTTYYTYYTHLDS